jgi:hypothetical protein
MQVQEVQTSSGLTQLVDQHINTLLPMVRVSQQALHVLQKD